MSDKEQTTAADILPKQKKSEKTNTELWLTKQSEADALKANILGDFQRRLEAFGTEKKLLEEKGIVFNWSEPTWNQALSDLGLSKPYTPPKPTLAGSSKGPSWGGTKAGKLIMEKYSKGDTFGVDDIMKKFDLTKSTATQYLSKGSSSGYLESLGGGKYKRVR